LQERIFLSSLENPQFEPQTASGEPPTPLAVDQFPPAQLAEVVPAPKAGENPVWNGWDVLLIAVLAVASVVVFGVLLVVGAHVVFPRASVGGTALPAILAQFLAYVVVAIYMVTLVEGKYQRDFLPAIRWAWPRSPWKLIGLGAFLLLALGLLGRFLPMPKSTPFEDFFKRPADAYILSLFAITLGPLMEELFFRGFLYPVLERRMGVAWGILFTALPFGLMHMFQYGYAWGVVLLIFLMGVVCTAVRAKTGSVAASFLVHVGYNATDMLILAIATGGFRQMEKAATALASLKLGTGY
jgi:membrane protease YdiL (CAAX protease family)